MWQAGPDACAAPSGRSRARVSSGAHTCDATCRCRSLGGPALGKGGTEEKGKRARERGARGRTDSSGYETALAVTLVATHAEI